MAVKIADWVKETSATTGAGPYSLAGVPSADYLSFLAVFGNGGQFPYIAFDGTNREAGVGTVNSGSPNTITRTRITASTNGGAAVSWSGATITLVCGPHADFLSTDYWMKQTGGRTLTSSTSLQKIFDKTSNGALTLPAGVYSFDCFLYLTSMSATSGNALFNILGAGTAILADVGYSVTGIDASTPTNAAAQTGSAAITNATPAAMVTAGTGTAMMARIRGTFNVTAGGTIIPSVQLLTAAAAAVNAATYIAIRKMGESGETYRGPWS